MSTIKPHARTSPLAAALFAIATAGLSITAAPAFAAPTANIVGTAVGSADHTTLVAAVKAAGLVDTLSGNGPFTVFAPTNAAFAKLPAGTVDNLLKPENKAQLQSVLTYHVVAGKLMAKDVLAAIKAGGGKAVVTTVQGGKLTASLMGDTVMLTDAKGRMAHVTAADLDTTNGVIHVIDAVVLP
jgi:uncharacterized surface protein with fasciclin (FAS1) repeats